MDDVIITLALTAIVDLYVSLLSTVKVILRVEKNERYVIYYVTRLEEHYWRAELFDVHSSLDKVHATLMRIQRWCCLSRSVEARQP
jgi:hypothetical protein